MEAATFIKNAIRKNESVFVHCHAGISRSCSCIIAYLILYHGLSTSEGLDIVRKGRPFVNPNPGFLK